MCARRMLAVATLVAAMSGQPSHAEPVSLFAAGSLKAALGDVAAEFEKRHQAPVATTFGPSGLLRERIEAGEPAQVFASANMKHPQTLATARGDAPVVRFARNRLCAITQPGSGVTSANLLERMLDPAVRVGTSTPKADPSGDYAWKLFERAEQVRPGAFATLDAKAEKLTGGPDSEKAPPERQQYAWVMTEKKPDVFLTYCTNAVLARKDTPSLEQVAIPDELAVGADYGLLLLDESSPAAVRLALFILSPDGQRILAQYGFDAAGR